jgi:CRP/FNR family transcriptional regulator, cyclic AMP receptor protein
VRAQTWRWTSGLAVACPSPATTPRRPHSRRSPVFGFSPRIGPGATPQQPDTPLSLLLPLVKVSITLTNVDESLYEQPLPLITDEELAELEGIGHTIHRSAGHPFFLEGEHGDFALLIRKGHVKAMRGRPPRIIDVRGSGEIVGEMAVVRKKPRMASIIAFDDVEALYLPGARWLRFLYDHPRAMHALLAMTDDMADRASMKNVESELAIEQQLAKRVIELTDFGLGEPVGEGAVVLRLSQQDLAALIGAKKLDSVKKVIRLLKAASIIDTGRQAITILKPVALREIADGNLTVS